MQALGNLDVQCFRWILPSLNQASLGGTSKRYVLLAFGQHHASRGMATKETIYLALRRPGEDEEIWEVSSLMAFIGEAEK